MKIAGIDPPIWRRFRISSSNNFAQLHLTLCLLYGWSATTSHWFQVGAKRIGPAGAADTNERKAKIIDYFRQAPRIAYAYGEENEWLLEITRAGEHEDAFTVPEAVDGDRIAPPASIEGPVDYAALRQALDDPADPDHHEALRLLGDSASGELDLTELNTRLQTAFS